MASASLTFCNVSLMSVTVKGYLTCGEVQQQTELAVSNVRIRVTISSTNRSRRYLGSYFFH